MLSPIKQKAMWGAALLALLCMAMMTACATSQPDVTNTAGTYSALVKGTPAEVIEAADDAVEDLELIKVSAESTDVDGLLIARTANDTRVTITTFTEGDGISKLNVRVGLTGDGEMSHAIIDRIKEDLGWPIEKVIPTASR